MVLSVAFAAATVFSCSALIGGFGRLECRRQPAARGTDLLSGLAGGRLHQFLGVLHDRLEVARKFLIS